MSNPVIHLPPLSFQEMKFLDSTMRLKMLNRLNNTHYRETKEVDAYVGTVVELDHLKDEVCKHTREGWFFEGLFGDDYHGAYLSFYKMVPWTEEEIKEAKDWLEANPEPTKGPVSWRKVATTVYEEGGSK